ncbi:MAG: thiol protease/hemagglutinin PrtT [Lewinellaceae bacterium]|nr:thiol protease/hemagglutinin PrtT [Lewinellaceae bacterium]
MRTFLIACISIFYFNQWAYAGPVDPSTAATVAKHFYQSTPKGASFSDNIQLTQVYGAQSPANQALVYAFNINNSDGFVLVAGDDIVTPILGYSDTGSIDPDNLADNFAKWLEGYKHEIMYAINEHLEPSGEIRAKWATYKQGTASTIAENAGIGPLLTSTWGQSPYYNEYCPGGSVTGCVATAMAQVMNYWQFPYQGTGYHTYVEDDYGQLFANFDQIYFLWGLMPDNVTSSNPYVATLMTVCGIAVDMNYSPSGSGAQSANIAPALINYFGYDPNLKLEYKSSYSDQAWTAKLLGELNAGRPMIYGGNSSFNGGHEFVCDGYQIDPSGNYVFHINWGWSGSQNGYFQVNALNPGSFNFSEVQSAVFGMKPDPQSPPNLQMLAPSVVEPDTTLVYGTFMGVGNVVVNFSSGPFNGKLAVALYREYDNSFVAILDSTNATVPGANGGGDFGQYEYSIGQVNNVLPGSYYISYLYKNQNSNTWVRIKDGAFAQNKTNIFIWDESWLFELAQVTVSSNVVQPNTPFTVTAKVVNVNYIPSFSGSLRLDLYSLDGNFISSLAWQGLTLGLFATSNTLTFNCAGLNVPPGAYRLVLAENNAQTSWKIVSAGDYPSNILITVSEPPIQADVYEPNNTQASAYVLPLPFAGTDAATATPGANMHLQTDVDHFKVDLPAGYTYELTPRVHDSYSTGNGQTYTNDVAWSYTIGNGPPSESFDDVLIAPNNTVTVQGDNTVYFKVWPYYGDTKGTYLFDLKATRQAMAPANDAACAAILVPADGTEQSGFSNIAATTASGENALVPPTNVNDCINTWCENPANAITNSVWFRFVAPATGAVEVSTCNLANFDTQIAVYSVGNCSDYGSYTLLAANDDGPCGLYTSLLNVYALSPGQTYYIIVDGYDGATGSLGIKVTPIPASAAHNVLADSPLLSVYPNPSTGNLTISLEGNNAMESYTLSDLSGRVVKNVQLSQSVQQATAALRSLPKGMYMLQVRSGDKVFTEKIVLQ